MAAGTYDFTIEQGATFSRVLTWRDDAGALVNLTGYTARMHLRTSITAVDPPALTLTDANSRIILGGAAGTITLALTATETAALGTPGAASTFVYDLELVSGATVTRLLEGTVTVDPEVTR